MAKLSVQRQWVKQSISQRFCFFICVLDTRLCNHSDSLLLCGSSTNDYSRSEDIYWWHSESVLQSVGSTSWWLFSIMCSHKNRKVSFYDGRNYCRRYWSPESSTKLTVGTGRKNVRIICRTSTNGSGIYIPFDRLTKRCVQQSSLCHHAECNLLYPWNWTIRRCHHRALFFSDAPKGTGKRL